MDPNFRIYDYGSFFYASSEFGTQIGNMQSLDLFVVSYLAMISRHSKFIDNNCIVKIPTNTKDRRLFKVN